MFSLYGPKFDRIGVNTISVYTTKAWWHGRVVTQLKDAILDALWAWADDKTTTKVKIQPGWPVPCKQSENIELFQANEVSAQIFQLVENSCGAV